MANSPKKIIIDVDVGTDDYIALLMLFNAEKQGKIKIEAIFCSMGNTSLDHVCKNVVRLLEITKRTDIPVYKGVRNQIILPTIPIQHFHGIDGFGDLKYDSEPDLSIIRNTSSVIALHDIVEKNPNEITLIFVGPLTNLALSLKLYDDLAEKIKELWIMGGNYTARGNVTASAEYNFFVDPEAAHIVFENIKCPFYMLPWETCVLTRIPFEWRWNALGDKSPALKLLTKAERKIYADKSHIDSWLPCDGLAIFAFLNPEKHIVRKSSHHGTVELSSNTRGQVILDHLKNKKPNVVVIEEVDMELFKQELLNTIHV